MRNFTAPLILSLIQHHAGAAKVMTPDIRQMDRDFLFAPQLSERKAWEEDQTRKAVRSGKSVQSTAYRFTGGPYDEKSTFWIDKESHILQCYEFHAPNEFYWKTELTHFNGTDEPRSLSII